MPPPPPRRRRFRRDAATAFAPGDLSVRPPLRAPFAHPRSCPACSPGRAISLAHALSRTVRSRPVLVPSPRLVIDAPSRAVWPTRSRAPSSCLPLTWSCHHQRRRRRRRDAIRATTTPTTMRRQCDATHATAATAIQRAQQRRRRRVVDGTTVPTLPEVMTRTRYDARNDDADDN
jgi:hypothetical protein